jgi:hypothetical protein
LVLPQYAQVFFDKERLALGVALDVLAERALYGQNPELLANHLHALVAAQAADRNLGAGWVLPQFGERWRRWAIEGPVREG